MSPSASTQAVPVYRPSRTSHRSECTQPGAVSAGGSNRAGQEVGEDFCWGSVVENTPWSVVELAGHKGEVGLVVGDLGALGKYSRNSPLVFSLVPRSHGERDRGVPRSSLGRGASRVIKVGDLRRVALVGERSSGRMSGPYSRLLVATRASLLVHPVIA